MNTSPTIASIAAALAKAQGEITNPVKDRTARVKSDKADYTYNYADLSNVLDCVRPVLARHGVAIVQTPEVSGDLLTMHTRLIHSSGEWIESQLSSAIDPMAKIQTLGSAITYLRRYSLQAIVGVVAEEDDDGNAAQGNRASTETRAAPRREVVKPPAPAAPAPAPAAPAATNGHPPTVLDDLRAAFKTASDATSRDQALASLSKTCGKAIASAVDVPPGDYKRAITALLDLAGVPS